MRNYIETLNDNSRNGGLNRFANNAEPNTVGAIGGNQNNSFLSQNNRTSTSFASKK